MRPRGEPRFFYVNPPADAVWMQAARVGAAVGRAAEAEAAEEAAAEEAVEAAAEEEQLLLGCI